MTKGQGVETFAYFKIASLPYRFRIEDRPCVKISNKVNLVELLCWWLSNYLSFFILRAECCGCILDACTFDSAASRYIMSGKNDTIY